MILTKQSSVNVKQTLIELYSRNENHKKIKKLKIWGVQILCYQVHFYLF